MLGISRHGDELRSRKGLNLPGIDLGISAFTEHDLACLKSALENGVDAISQSFVEVAADVDAVRKAAAALGHAAIGHGCHVQWFSLETLGALINRHRVDDSTSRAIRKIMRADLICIDDIGLLPVATETAEALYRVVDAAYEKRSIALSSNLHPAGFDELMPKTIANATSFFIALAEAGSMPAAVAP